VLVSHGLGDAGGQQVGEVTRRGAHPRYLEVQQLDVFGDGSVLAPPRGRRVPDGWGEASQF
jgi:hypothetical protein